MSTLASLIIGRRGVILAMAAAITALAAAGVLRLRFDDQPRHLFRADDAEAARLDALFEEFGSDDRDVMIVVDELDLVQPDHLAFMERVVTSARGLEGVATVRSVLDVVVFPAGGLPTPLFASGMEGEDLHAARSIAAEHPLVRGHLLSEDLTAGLIIISLDESHDEVNEVRPIVRAIAAILEEARSILGEDASLRARITGIPPLRVEIIDSLRRDQAIFLVTGAAVGILLVFLFFRRPGAVLIVSVVPIIGTLWTLGALGWAGEDVNVISAVLPTLVLVIGFTDSVHLMMDIRRSRASGASGLQASHDAIRHLGLACALTSLTTMVGFASLTAAKIEVIRRFGLACAAGTGITFLTVITLVPLIASMAPMHWIVEPGRFGRLEARRERRVRIIEPVLRAPVAASLAAVTLTGLLAVAALQLRPDNRLSETIPQDRGSVQALLFADEHFGGILPLYVRIESPEGTPITSSRALEATRQVHEVFERQAALSRPFSILNVYEALPSGGPLAGADAVDLMPPRLRGRFVQPESRSLVVLARTPDMGAVALESVLVRIEDDLSHLRDAFPGFRFDLTGTTAVAARNVQLMIGDLARSLGLASIVIFGVMALAFRSLRLGLICIIPNIFPLVATAALLYLLGRPLQITSVIVFSVCLGIAVDDTIHFVTRFRRERDEHGGRTLPAIRRSFFAVGAALVVTTAVLIGGFGVVGLSEVPALRLFAMLSCTAIAAALVGDLIILPALLAALLPDSKRRSPPAPADATGDETGHQQDA